jgi:hypothetical protein
MSMVDNVVSTLQAIGADIKTLAARVAKAAPLDSPKLTGTPSAPTPAADENSDRLPTTKWVAAKLAGLSSGGGASGTRKTLKLSGTAGQRLFTIPGGYIPNQLDVFINGVLLTEYTATTGNTLLLRDGLDSASDVLTVVPYIDKTPTIVPATDAFFDAAKALNPTAYLRFNETSGMVVKDSSGNGRDFTSASNASTLTAPGLLGTSEDAAFSLPGTVQEILRAGGTPVNKAQDFSIFFLINATAIPPKANVGAIFQLGQENGAPELDIVGTSAGYTFRFMRSGVAGVITTTVVHPYNQTMACCLRYSVANGFFLTVNNQLVGSAKYAFPDSTTTARIGCAFIAAVDYPFVGRIDEMVFYQSFLSDDNVTRLTNLT